MIICHNPPFVFISTPRAGTHSMYHFLCERFGLEKPSAGLPFHRRAVPSKYVRYFRFTTCRNPYPRAVSGWWALSRHRRYREEWLPRFGSEDFTDAMRWRAGQIPKLTGRAANILWSQAIWQDGFTYPPHKVLRLEAIDAETTSLPFIGEAVKVARLGPHYGTGIMEYGDWKQIMTDEAAEHIRRWAAEDFRRFNYSTNWRDA